MTVEIKVTVDMCFIKKQVHSILLEIWRKMVAQSMITRFWRLWQCSYYKVRLWVLMRDQSLTHLSTDISLIPKHILNLNISLES